MTAERCGVGLLLDLDPDLGRFLTPQERRIARLAARVELCSLGRGHWHPNVDPIHEKAHYGLLVVDGALSRRIKVANRSSLELLGEGDLLCPDVLDADPDAQVPQSATWEVLVESRVIVLDDALIAGLAGLRRVLGELQRRSVRRSHRLALRLALAAEHGLDARLERLLRHLADGWGVRSAGDVVIDLPLSPSLLADFAGADRSATTRSLARLYESGLVERRNDGSFALRGAPPERDQAVD